MKIEYPGKMKPFAELGFGEFFLFFVDSTPGVGMKIRGADPAAVKVVDFTQQPHPQFPGPSMVDSSLFANRDVLVLDDAVFKPTFDRDAIKEGSPPNSNHAAGTAIIVGDTVLLRVYHREGPYDVDLSTGLAQSARSHPGSMWVDSWEVVINAAAEVFPGKPKVVVDRSETAVAKRAA